jgi:hypothetical protein
MRDAVAADQLMKQAKIAEGGFRRKELRRQDFTSGERSPCLAALISQVRLVLQNDLIALPGFLGADAVAGALGAEVVFRKPCL